MRTLLLVSVFLLTSATTSIAQQTIDCRGITPNAKCSEVWQQGHRFMVVRNENVTVVSSDIVFLDKKIFYRWVGIVNNGDAPIDIAPEQFTGTLSDKATILASDPLMVLQKRERHQGVMNTFQGAVDSALNGNDPVLVTDTSQPSRTVTYFTDAPSERQNQRQSVIKSQTSSLESQTLLHTTLTKGSQVLGTIYFERPKNADKHAYLESTQVVVSGTTYVF